MSIQGNLHEATVADFGREWTHYDQSPVSESELRLLFDRYFAVFPWESLEETAVGFDLGCGSGRWARLVAPRVGTLYCLDASEAAIRVARRNLQGEACHFAVCSVDLPFRDASMDFGYSLGVLHHVPDTAAAVRAFAAKLKPGAPLLLYLYYAFDNRPGWFRLLWLGSDVARRVISRAPFPVKLGMTRAAAAAIYWPLARLSRVAEILGADVSSWPLSFYRKQSFYTMRTDALDRFGTRLERRFTSAQIRKMLEDAGLEDIVFSTAEPYWCVLGRRRLMASTVDE